MKVFPKLWRYTLSAVNLLYLDASRGLYGASRMLLTLLVGLDRSQVNPYVILANDIEKEEVLLPATLQALRIPFQEETICVLRRSKYLSIRGGAWMVGALLRSLPRLVRLIRQQNIQLIHTNTSTVLSGAIAAALTRTPHVWSVHEVMRWEGWILSPLLHLLSTWVIANSEAVAENLQARFPLLADKMRVIKNGLDPYPYAHVPKSELNRIRRELQLTPDDLVVTMIGRIGAAKGEYLFLDMAGRVARQRQGVKFLIVGGVFDGRDFHLEDLRRQIQADKLEDRVTATGYRTDIPAVIACSDIVVLPSIRPESFGLVLLEAMAAGKPVVATNLGGPREIVQAGVNGFLVDHTEATEMAARVLQLLEDKALRRRLGQAGRARVESEFSQQRYAEAYQRLYQEILAES